jgi:hypothetical protein
MLFSQRDPRYARELDSVLKNIVDSQIPTRDRADAELELETRAWLRDFWSRSIVAWLALLISIVSIAVAICSFSLSVAQARREAPQETKSP